MASSRNIIYQNYGDYNGEKKDRICNDKCDLEIYSAVGIDE